MKSFALLFLALGCAFGQAVYIEPPPALTVSGNPPLGSFPAVLAASGALVSVCTYPSCASLAQTYTDATAVTPCPTNAQAVIAGTSACTNAADVRGNFGFWLLTGGQYQYKITLRNGTVYGPFPVTMQTNNAANVQIVGPDSLPYTVQNLSNSAYGSSLVSTIQGGTGATGRTVKSKLNDAVNVKDFGATGDGTTDDTAAIQAAIDAQRAGLAGPVSFAPGTYAACAVKVYANTELRGQRTAGSYDPAVQSGGSWPGLVLLVQKAGCDNDVIKTVDQSGPNFAHGLTIRDLDIIGSPLTNTLGNGLNLFQIGENSWVDGVRVSRMPEAGIYVHGSSAPLHLGRVSLQENLGNGLLVDANATATQQFDFISGDNNGGCLAKWQNVGTNTVTVWGWKSERSNNALGVGNSNVFCLSDTPDLDFILGAGQIYWDNVAAAGNAIVYQSGAGAANVTVLGSVRITGNLAAYAYGYQSATTGRTTTLTDFTSVATTGPQYIRQKATGTRDLWRIFRVPWNTNPATNDPPDWKIDSLGHLSNVSTSPANPNIVTWNNTNLSGTAQGGFFSVNSRYLGGVDWSKTSTNAYSGSLYMRMSAQKWEIRFGQGTNTDGGEPGYLAFGAVTAAGGNTSYAARFTGQTANILELRNESGTALAWFDSNAILRTAGRKLAYSAVTSGMSPYAMPVNQDVLQCDASGGAITLTLPTAVGAAGRTFTVKKADASGNACTVGTTGGQAIDAAGTFALSAQWKYVRVVSNDANWLIIGSN